MSAAFNIDPAKRFIWPTPGLASEVQLYLQRTPSGLLRVRAMYYGEGYPEPFADLSTLPDTGRGRAIPQEPDTFYAKDYSENEGVVDALIEQGFAVRTGHYVEGGFATFPLLRLTEKGRQLSPELF